MESNVISMVPKRMANILYNLSLGLDYADGIEYAEEEIQCIEKQIQLLADNECDSILVALDQIACKNEKMENWHERVRTV